MRKVFELIIGLFLLFGCAPTDIEDDHDISSSEFLFTKVEAEQTHITFSNRIKEDTYFNFINYPYVYNGGGVSAADFNNDGLIDLYFTANQTSNKLFLNKGDFEFEDITNQAGVGDTEGWTTGTTVIDINNDGLLDLYVCKSGSLRSPKIRENLLFVNQGNNQFENKAEEWGLNDPGFSIQSYFLDFDKDGDLDMYLVNHRPDFENNATISSSFEARSKSPFTDRLYRNDGVKYIDVSAEAGIENNSWGLSASIGDFNNDGWPDIYVCNDFLEPDFLYINNKIGSFQNMLNTSMGHISMNSMGSDYNDIDNDGNMDLLVAEMSPNDHVRSKSNMPSMSTENFNAMVAADYHFQYMSNSLQLNRGDGKYSEIAQMAGFAATDWSWSPLIADFDNDGYKDVFFTNGIIKDLSNSDFRDKLKSKIAKREKMSLDQALSMIPSEPITNPIFKNNGDLTFTQNNQKWNINIPSFSHGAVYADLDNDGDLDLITNNANDSAFVYRNNTNRNSINIKLKGSKQNTLGIGTKVNIYTGHTIQSAEMYLSRGYQSSVPNMLHFGMGTVSTIDSLVVTWSDGNQEVLKNIEVNQLLTLNYEESRPVMSPNIQPNGVFLKKITSEDIGVSFKHHENAYNDYEDQLLLPYKLSQSGPFVAKGDVNNDGLEDFFVGGAAGQSGQMYIQQSSGMFKLQTGDWINDKQCEDVGGIFFDIDNDDDLDLYIVSGGSEFENGDHLLQDRLYINDKGHFKKSLKAVPEIFESGKVVVANDYDVDGDIDLFVGGRIIPGRYPESPKSYFLINENGVLVDNTVRIAPGLSNLGMVTGAEFTDYDLDGDHDLMVVGEWSRIQLLENNEGIFTPISAPTLEHTSGLWYTLSKHDIDGDGDDDYFLGNLGLNSKYKAGNGKEFHIYADDFDASGNVDIVLSNKYKEELVPLRGRECSSQQTPFIKDKFPDYNSFAKASMNDIFGEKNLINALHFQVDLFESIMLRNNGTAGFEIIKLPNRVQTGPILDFTFVDVDGDSSKEVLAVGNIYETEVETVRMDASKGHVFSWNNEALHVLSHKKTGFFIEGNAKSIFSINTSNDKDYILVGLNDMPVLIFKN